MIIHAFLLDILGLVIMRVTLVWIGEVGKGEKYQEDHYDANENLVLLTEDPDGFGLTIDQVTIVSPHLVNLGIFLVDHSNPGILLFLTIRPLILGLPIVVTPPVHHL